MPVKTSLFALILASLAAQAQPQPTPPLLTPQEAVRLGIENNPSLSLAQDQAQVAENNRKAGIGPFLPEVSASAAHGGIIGESGTATSVGASASLLLFDGFQSYHAYRRLKSFERSAALEQRAALEGTLEAILSGYYTIAQQKRRLAAIRELLAVSGERARLAQARMEVGAGSKLEQLQSLSDLNADSAAFLAQESALKDAKVRLNVLLARTPGEDFDVVDTIPLEASLPVEAWKKGFADNNSTIRLAREDAGAARQSLKEARGGWWPDVNAGLRYSTSPEILSDPDLRDDGVAWSVNLSVPIFDRLRTRRDVGNARIGVRQGETRLRQQTLQAEADFAQALESHATGTRRVALEERNLEVSRLQAEAARERYRLGASSPLEFRDAQTRLLDSQSRLASARQETKLAELVLKRLAGVLVQDAPGGK